MSNSHDDPSGSRSIRLEVEVPGTPEEVWEAVATGRGRHRPWNRVLVRPGRGDRARGRYNQPALRSGHG